MKKKELKTLKKIAKDLKQYYSTFDSKKEQKLLKNLNAIIRKEKIKKIEVNYVEL